MPAITPTRPRACPAISRERPRILIVDDEHVIRSSFGLYFESLGYEVTLAEGGAEALEVFHGRESSLDVVLLDLVMPGMHGIEVLRRLKEINGSVEVIIATGCGSMNTAIEAMRQGAFDYITKPILDFDRDLLSVTRRALEARKARLKNGSADGNAAGADWLAELEGMARAHLDAGGSEDPLKGLERFFLGRMGAEGGLAFRRTAEGAITRLAEWGRTDDLTLGALFGPEELEDLFQRPFAWRSLPRRELEAILLPLFGRPNEACAGAGILLVRAPRSRESDSMPAPALLALLAEAILLGGSRRELPRPGEQLSQPG